MIMSECTAVLDRGKLESEGLELGRDLLGDRNQLNYARKPEPATDS